MCSAWWVCGEREHDCVFASERTLLENGKEKKVLQSEHDNRDGHGDDNPKEVICKESEPQEPNHEPEVCSDEQKTNQSNKP